MREGIGVSVGTSGPRPLYGGIGVGSVGAVVQSPRTNRSPLKCTGSRNDADEDDILAACLRLQKLGYLCFLCALMKSPWSRLSALDF